MANVAHSTLTGSNLHEPKGADAAALGQVYVSDGSGSGTWTTVTGLVFTGMIADFVAPIAPTGWLELDGSAVSSTTYSALFDSITIQRTGTRVGGLAIISGLPSTTGMKAGYYVFGTGITSGTTIVSVDSGTQITMSANAGSSGTSTVFVSTCLMNTGTFTLPDATTNARYRRSRSSTDPSLRIGNSHGGQNAAHTHTGTTDTGGVDHTHSGTTDAGGVDHTHTETTPPSTSGQFSGLISPNNGWGGVPGNAGATGTASAYLHQHSFVTGTASAANHTHTFTTISQGGTEVRTTALILMTCIKT